MKEAVTKVIDTLTQEDVHGVFQKLLEQYNKCIAAKGYYFEGDYSSMCVLSIKVPIRKKSGNLFNDPRTKIRKNQNTGRKEKLKKEKYLEILGADAMEEIVLKEKIRRGYLRRTRTLLETKLCNGNIMKKINTWVVPL